MAIISIPNSIGGVSIPGAIVEGPLGALFGNKFGRTDLQYPRDLQSSTRGHVVVFNINEVQPATYESLKSNVIKGVSSGINAITGLSYGSIASTAENTLNTTTSYIDDVRNGKISFGGEIDKSVAGLKEFLGNESINIKSPTKKSVASISLYIPDTMAFAFSAQYGQLSLVDAAAKVPLAGAAIGAVASIVKSDPGRLLAKGAGYAFNPQQQMLFDGIDFRPYQMSFTFTPYSKKEAETVAKIVKMFKMHAAPRLAEGSAGMFFIPPSTFNLNFLFNGKDNPNVGRVAESVIEGIDVNYSPNGFSTFGDGAPVQTTLTLNFREIELITRQKPSPKILLNLTIGGWVILLGLMFLGLYNDINRFF